MTVFYMGCWDRVGHYLAGPDPSVMPESIRGDKLDNPKRWGTEYGKQHIRYLHHVDGWTVLSMADRTVDTRPGSHATFAMAGTLTKDEAEALARAAFPTIWARVDAAALRAAPASEQGDET